MLEVGKVFVSEFNLNDLDSNEFPADGMVDARTVLDMQVNYRIPSLKSVIKLGGSNLTGEEFFSAPGVGAIGSQYYLSWTINN